MGKMCITAIPSFFILLSKFIYSCTKLPHGTTIMYFYTAIHVIMPKHSDT